MSKYLINPQNKRMSKYLINPQNNCKYLKEETKYISYPDNPNAKYMKHNPKEYTDEEMQHLTLHKRLGFVNRYYLG